MAASAKELKTADALKSRNGLVVVEAPAGCGKTYQAVTLAAWFAAEHPQSRALFLTHTNAAVHVFRSRTRAQSSRLTASTIDGFAIQIARMYHKHLGLPLNVQNWVLTIADGHNKVMSLVVRLLSDWRTLTRLIVARYPLVICDEYQDCTANQHDLILLLHKAGARLRVFGDPMQAIYASNAKEQRAQAQRWDLLCKQADVVTELDVPRRWEGKSVDLGEWVLEARRALKTGQLIRLPEPLPQGLQILYATNRSHHSAGFGIDNAEAFPLRSSMRRASMLILSPRNEVVRAIHAWGGGQPVIWEGHTRNRLVQLADCFAKASRNPLPIAAGVATFIATTSVGFTKAFVQILLDEVERGGVANRTGRPAAIQAMARFILASPDHVGAARALSHFKDRVSIGREFANMRIDYKREFNEAMKIGSFATVDVAMSALAAMRQFNDVSMPRKAISTVHKAKGLECDHALILPCNGTEFPDTDQKRRLLYVALSRSRSSLTLVLCKSNACSILG